MRKSGAKVLVIDDEVEIRRFLKIGLKTNDFIMLEAANGKDGLGLASIHRPDLVILDLGLPDISGFEFLKTIREWSKVPVIVLSVRKEEHEKVEAFDLGANDYVTKPFGMSELVARVKAQLRDNILKHHEETLFTIGNLEMDLIARKVSLRGERIQLTPKEYDLLSILVQNAGKVIPHRQLIRELWGSAYGDDNQYLRVYVRQLRRKIEKDRMRDQYIHTEAGIGYRLEYTPAI